jgi:hypothetical protein
MHVQGRVIQGIMEVKLFEFKRCAVYLMYARANVGHKTIHSSTAT